MNRKASTPRRPARAAPADSGLAEAMAMHRAGRLDDAEQGYRQIKRRDPGYVEALRLRGVLAHQRGRGDTAAKLLREAIKQQPSNPVNHHTLAELLRAAGQPDDAIAGYRRAFALQPERGENGVDLGDTLAQAGHSDEAIATYRGLLERHPSLASAHTRIATLLFERGEPQAAKAQIQSWQTQAPADAATGRNLARAFAAIGACASAERIYRDLLASDPVDAQACAGLGSVLQSRGAFDEATYWFERALELQPDLGWVYAALMTNRGYAVSPQREMIMQRLVDAAATDKRDRIHLHFALGQLHQGRAEHAEAFVQFDAGNRLQARATPFNPSAFDERIERILAHFNTVFFQQKRAFGDASERPLFVVGMPRSGTSLVEQIIASHPQAYGAGELNDIRRMIRELPALAGTRQRYPECLDWLTADQAGSLAQRYLGALSARSPDALRVTDKMPFNMLWLGLIALLFPNARVVYCRREPMDNCLSCYLQIFNEGLRFSYDLEHLGQVYRQHERLMAHWQECLMLPMLTVDYESLVDAPEAEIRRLIGFAGLPWDDACLAFHRTARDVRTASVWQVRQPVYRSSVARWHAYDPWLGPLRDALAR